MAERCAGAGGGDSWQQQGRPVWGFLRGRRYPLSAPGRQPGQPADRGFLHRGIRAQPPDPQLRQALHRLHGRHRDGGRHGHQPGRCAACSDRTHQDGHARNRDWPVPGRGWWVLSEPLPRPGGRVAGPDGRHHRRRRCHCLPAGRWLHAVRPAGGGVGRPGHTKLCRWRGYQGLCCFSICSGSGKRFQRSGRY